jgi:sarcosine oxidase subunit alpha
MVEGRMAGLAAALSLGCRVEDADGLKRELREELEMLRRGPVGEKIREGIKRVLIGRLEISKNPQPRR